MAGKGDTRRPTLISPEEEQLRWDYALGKLDITEDEFKEKTQTIRAKVKARSHTT